MSKLSEKLNEKKFIITAELFPPKGVDISNLMYKADLIAPLIDAINITDNQRASMRLGPLAICRLLKEKGYEPILQMTCRDRNRIALQSDLLSAFTLGIDNVLILSGDHPRLGENKGAKAVYDLDPVQLLSVAGTLESGFDMVGKKLSGAPKFCLGAVVNPTLDPVDLQIMMMEKKIKAGARFFQTQTIFDVEQFKVFFEKVKHHNVKILAGVILLKSVPFLKFMQNLPGVNVPEKYVKRMESASDPLEEGIRICADTISELKTFADGVHIMAIGSEDQIPKILENVR